MKYVLEHPTEAKRLESQSKTDAFNFERELSGVDFNPNGVILDAGCGSGIVTRFLATKYPYASIIGCDSSIERIDAAKKLANYYTNIEFKTEDLLSTNFKNNSLDGIVCRYVLEHLPSDVVIFVLKEFNRILKPNGIMCLIDVDGYPGNIFPQTESVKTFITNLEAESQPDMRIGRKLPYYLEMAGIKNVDFRIDTLTFKGDELVTEISQIEGRFKNTRPITEKLMGSLEKADEFEKDYLSTARAKGSVLFYNMFIVTAIKEVTLKAVTK